MMTPSVIQGHSVFGPLLRASSNSTHGTYFFVISVGFCPRICSYWHTLVLDTAEIRSFEENRLITSLGTWFWKFESSFKTSLHFRTYFPFCIETTFTDNISRTIIMAGDHRYIASVVATYWFVSISMVYLNKVLMSNDGISIDAPLFVTWFQCIVTALICVGAGHVGDHFRRADYNAVRQTEEGGEVKPSFFAQFPKAEYRIGTGSKVFPLSLVFVGMITFNNLCLKWVEVSFYNVVSDILLKKESYLFDSFSHHWTHDNVGQKFDNRFQRCIFCCHARKHLLPQNDALSRHSYCRILSRVTGRNQLLFQRNCGRSGLLSLRISQLHLHKESSSCC